MNEILFTKPRPKPRLLQRVYLHAVWLCIQVTRELEAEEARDKLSLAKLENTALHRKAEYMV